MVVTMITRGSSKLLPSRRKKLILGLCRALCVLNSPKEVAEALTDLLTAKEIETIAKRLEIAEYLVKGADYDSIRRDLKVGYSTIARINTWLNLSGEGFKLMFSRRKKAPQGISDEERYDPLSWHNIKRRYSLYFWPQLLLEELVKNADHKEKEKIFNLLDNLDIKKNQFTSKSNKQMYEMFASNFKKKPNSRQKKTKV